MKISSSNYKDLFKAGLRLNELNFLLDLNSCWLKNYENDIEAQINQANLHSLLHENKTSISLFSSILKKDPENIDIYRKILPINKTESDFYQNAIFVVSNTLQEPSNLEKWGIFLKAAKKAHQQKNQKEAKRLINSALQEAPDNILVAITHAQIECVGEKFLAAEKLCQLYMSRWDSCLQFKLELANLYLKNFKEDEAINILHDCMRLDPGGVVVRRNFGEDHEFCTIWPKSRSVEYKGAIPSEIAIALNWQQLADGNISRQLKNRHSNDKKSIDEIEKLVQETPPEKIYVIFSSYKGLAAKYGPKTTDFIIDLLEQLAIQVSKRGNWEAKVFLPDSPKYAERHGISSISRIDPWKLKLSLMDLNKVLEKKGQKIGSVIVIGGDEVVPFHRLPNPTDDSDDDVLSDNPYATPTSNYLLPRWPVGRLVGEAGNDPGLILEQIRHIINFHKEWDGKPGFLERIISTIKSLVNLGELFKRLFNKPKDFGYSAEVWRRSSIAAFRPIGSGSDLRVSPPYDHETIDVDQLLKAKSAYFNLHGLANTSEWYGQRDFSGNSDGPDFPVAISTEKIGNQINNIDLVFTEACYGGLVNGKSINDSIALKFLSIGSQGVVGSTCISYGSIFTPLIGGDLLGFIFWKFIKEGFSFGEALLKAKNGLSKVIMQRQGYLDGEDQKTLLSFVLYGDPLGCLEPHIYLDRVSEEIHNDEQIEVVNDSDGVASSDNLPSSLTRDIQEMLESYVPGLESAKVKVKKHRIAVRKMIDENNNNSPHVGSNLTYIQVTQVHYSKSIICDEIEHTQFARISMNDMGKITKLAVSR